MKKIFFTALVGAMMISCSRDNDDNGSVTNDTSILPTKIISSYKYREDIETTYTYNGNKLVKESSKYGNDIFYTYTGDLITSIKGKGGFRTFTYDSNDNLISEKYVYNNGRIKTLEYNVTYTINGSTVTAHKISKGYDKSDGTLSYTITTNTTYTLDKKKRPIKYTIALQKVGEENVNLNGTCTYSYNNHMSVMQNITGMDKLAYSSVALGLSYYSKRSNFTVEVQNYLLLPFSYAKEDLSSYSYPHEEKIEYTLNANNYPTRTKKLSYNPYNGQYEDNGYYYTIEYNK